ncbi:MAG: hypothetical protein AAGN46_05240 [Acidobacteriota bacterium]
MRSASPFGGGGRPPAQFAMPGPPPRDILILIVVLFATFSLSAFASGWAVVRLLQLSSQVWTRGFVWQVLTYPFASDYSGGLFFLLTLVMVWWFGGDVFRALGRRRFWTTFGLAALAGALAALLVQFLMSLGGGAAPIQLLQGSRMVIAFAIAAFATLFGHAQILLFFVLPIRARWFLWIEVLFAFMAFLSTQDFAGFIGLLAIIGVTYVLLSGDGPGRMLQRLGLRFRKSRIEREMKRRRGRSNLRPIDGGRRDPWVH